MFNEVVRQRLKAFPGVTEVVPMSYSRVPPRIHYTIELKNVHSKELVQQLVDQAGLVGVVSSWQCSHQATDHDRMCCLPSRHRLLLL